MISSLPGLLLLIVVSFVSLLIYTSVEMFIKDYLEERKRVKEQEKYEEYWERYSEYRKNHEEARKRNAEYKSKI